MNRVKLWMRTSIACICVLSLAASLAMSATAEDLFDEVEHRYAVSGDVRIHYAVTGPKDAPLVVFLHGFPDFWYSWREQMAALRDRFQVAALDLRGYNRSDKPEGVANYAMPHLVADVAAVIAAEKREHAVVVGHDWGGAVAWNVAMTRPELVRLLVILNLPHPRGLFRELTTNAAQRRNSQYAFNFQQPDAHKTLTAQGLAFWVRDPEAKKRYVAAFEQSDFEAMLNYYKANYPRPPEPAAEGTAPTTAGTGLAAPDMPNVRCPVLMFHGLDDTALLPGALAGTWNWVDADLTLVTIPGADHFVQQDASDLVSTTMRDWLLRRAD